MTEKFLRHLFWVWFFKWAGLLVEGLASTRAGKGGKL